MYLVRTHVSDILYERSSVTETSQFHNLGFMESNKFCTRFTKQNWIYLWGKSCFSVSLSTQGRSRNVLMLLRILRLLEISKIFERGRCGGWGVVVKGLVVTVSDDWSSVVDVNKIVHD